MQLYAKLRKQFGWNRLTRRERRQSQKLDKTDETEKLERARFRSSSGSEQRPESSQKNNSEVNASPGQKRKFYSRCKSQIRKSRRPKSPRIDESIANLIRSKHHSASDDPQGGKKIKMKDKTKVWEQKTDPITLCDLGKNVFTTKRSDGKKGTSFDVETLVNYILLSGDFTNPTTRVTFTESELKRLDKCANNAGLTLPSVRDLRDDLKYHEQRKQKKFRRDAMLGLDRCLGEVVGNMVDLIETCENAELGEIRLVTELFPLFSFYLRQISDVDSEFARQCVKHYREYTTGPPNKPINDAGGLKAPVLRFLEQALKSPRVGDDSHFLQGFSSNTASANNRNNVSVRFLS